MCVHKDNCAFYLTYNMENETEEKYQLLIETYCHGELNEVCRRVAHKEKIAFAKTAEVGPNGCHVYSYKRIY